MAFQVSEDVVRNMLDEEYGMRKATGCSLLPGSVMNPNWVVDLGLGRYVARCFLRNRDPARISFQTAYHLALAQMGFPVPRIQANRRGEAVTAYAGETWALYEWIGGEEYDYASHGQLDAAGRLLGELHGRLTRLDIPGYVEPAGFPPYSRWASGGLALLEDNMGDGAWLGLSPGDVRLALSMQRWMAETLSVAQYEALPKLYVWGDFHGRNMKFLGEEIVGLFDFDVVRWESPAYDLGTGVFMFCRQSRSDPAIRLDAVSRLVKAYSRERTVPDVEAVAVLPLLVYRYITDLYQPDPLPPGSDAPTHARRAIRILRAVWEVRDSVAEIVTER